MFPPLYGIFLMIRRTKGQSRPGFRRRSPRAQRGGAVTLELILTVPIWLILLWAIVEWGQILSNQQQVALAARVGAEEASQTSGLASAASVPSGVLTAIDQQLASSNISRCKVIVEHNLNGPLEELEDSSGGPCDCDPPSTGLLPTNREYVRVTVCVPLTELACNLLGPFGFDISDCIVQHSATFRYEL
jgi:hypothetical protein